MLKYKNKSPEGENIVVIFPLMEFKKTLKKIRRNNKFAMFTVILQLSKEDIFSMSLSLSCGM